MFLAILDVSHHQKRGCHGTTFEKETPPPQILPCSSTYRHLSPLNLGQTSTLSKWTTKRVVTQWNLEWPLRWAHLWPLHVSQGIECLNISLNTLISILILTAVTLDCSYVHLCLWCFNAAKGVWIIHKAHLLKYSFRGQDFIFSEFASD